MDTPPTKAEPCRICAGAGGESEREVFAYRDRFGARVQSRGWVRCEHCKGTGTEPAAPVVQQGFYTVADLHRGLSQQEGSAA